MDQLDLEIGDHQQDEASETKQQSIGFVKKLQEARMAKEMSVEDVADQLCLSVKVIKEIELGNEEFCDDVFIRGHIRSYARLVNVPNDVLEQGLIDLGISKKTKIINKANLKAHRQSTATDKSVRFVTYLIILLLLGSVISWWYLHSANENEVLKVQHEETIAPETTDTLTQLDNAYDDKIETPDDDESNDETVISLKSDLHDAEKISSENRKDDITDGDITKKTIKLSNNKSQNNQSMPSENANTTLQKDLPWLTKQTN